MQAANNIGTSLDFFLFVAFALFTIGAIGAMTRKNMIVLLMCIELMLNAVNLLLAAFSSYYADPAGQIFVLILASPCTHSFHRILQGVTLSYLLFFGLKHTRQMLTRQQ